MATVTVTLSDILKTNEATTGVTPSTYAAGDTIKIPMDRKNVVVAITGSTGNGTVTFDAGNGIAGTNTLAVSTANGKTTFIQLDSSSFEQIEGSDKGYATATAASNGGSIVAVSAL